MKILIVGPSWVGDSVISQSLIKVILSKSKEAKIDVLSPEWTRNIFKRMDEVSETITLPFSHGEMKIKERVDLGKTLKEKNYDQAIVLPNSFKSCLVPYFGEIPIRTGWRGEMRYFLINDMRILDKKIFPRMIDRFVALAFKKNENLPSSIPYPSLKVEEENLDSLRVNFGIDSILPLICLCPGAEFGPAKRWPTNYYSEVANDYLKKNWQVILLGSPNDIPVGEDIKKNINKESGFLNLIGKTKLVDTIDILSSSNLVLTNDSGLMHIAASVDVPLVALYGPTSPEFTPPLSNKVKVIKKNKGFTKLRSGDLEGGFHQSLKDIKPKEVLAALLEFES